MLFKILLFLLFMTSLNNAYSNTEDTNEIIVLPTFLEYSDPQQDFTITITNIVNGFLYTVYKADKKHTNTSLFQVSTNVNHATIGFTNYIHPKTNEFFIMAGALITPREWVDIGYTEVIISPEIQLQAFINSPTLTNISFVYVDPISLDVLNAHATKLPISNNIPKLEIVFDNKKYVYKKKIYSFNSNGLATQIEIFLKKGSKPAITLIKK